jgi:hypothetical protein
MRSEQANALVETGPVDPANDGLAMALDLDINANCYPAVEGRLNLVMHLVCERN